MSQNVMNNWFQKLGTDSNFLDRQVGTKSTAKSGSTFQSFLSQQIKKASPSGNEVKSDLVSNTPRENKSLKRMDTTASKLSVKSPERGVVKSVGETTGESSEKDNTVQKVNGKSENFKESKITKTEQNVEAEPIEAIKEDAETLDLSKIAPELLQMLQTLPEDVIAQLPEGLQVLVAEFSEQLQNILTAANNKVELENQNKVNSELSLNLNPQSDKQPLVKSELVESLKQVIGQLKASETVSGEGVKSFGNLLKQLKTQADQAEVAKPMIFGEGSQESKTAQVVTESSTVGPTAVKANENANNSENSKSDLNSNTPNQTLATETKVAKDTKVEVQTKVKVDTDTTVHNFSAKAEASGIAFGKQEVATQTVKNALHTNIMDQIINSPKLQIKQTEQGATMTLKLNPEVLGNVEIKMEIVKGVLQAEINVENMIVKGAIESSLADLKNALSDKGYQVETLNVSVGQESRESQHQRQQERHTNEKAAGFTPEELETINGSYEFDTVVNDTRINYLG